MSSPSTKLRLCLGPLVLWANRGQADHTTESISGLVAVRALCSQHSRLPAVTHVPAWRLRSSKSKLNGERKKIRYSQQILLHRYDAGAGHFCSVPRRLGVANGFAFPIPKHQGMPWCGGVLSEGHRAQNEPRVSHPVNRGERRNYMGIVGLVPCVVGLSFFWTNGQRWWVWRGLASKL